MADSLGVVVNAGLKVIGEPEITAFTATNILQEQLIEDANEGVHDLIEAARYRWDIHRDAFTTDATITTGTVVATNASTTITSSGDNFTDVEPGSYLKVGSDDTTYEVASVDTSVSPDTLVLSDAYLGTTAATASYIILRDTYPLSITSLDEVTSVSYSESSNLGGDDEVDIVDLRSLVSLAAGNLHRNTSGKPTYIAQKNPDSSNNPQFVLWPYPDTAYLINILHTLKFTVNSTFATEMFGGDAPDIAYDALRHRSRWRACVYDNDPRQAQLWFGQYERARSQLVTRENRAFLRENAFGVETYRTRTWRRGTQVVSQIAFDTI